MYRAAVQSEKLEKNNSNIPDIFFIHGRGDKYDFR
jgi:hypothetical protein